VEGFGILEELAEGEGSEAWAGEHFGRLFVRVVVWRVGFVVWCRYIQSRDGHW
jgi:hypothetical protein